MNELEDTINEMELEDMQLDKIIKIIYNSLNRVEDKLKNHEYSQAHSEMSYYCELMNGTSGRIYLYRNGDFNNIRHKYVSLLKELDKVTLPLFKQRRKGPSEYW